MIIKHETVLIIKHKETKKRSFFLDTKITSDLKVATKPTGWKQSIAGWKQSIAGMEIFVDFVKAALAASVFKIESTTALAAVLPISHPNPWGIRG